MQGGSVWIGRNGGSSVMATQSDVPSGSKASELQITSHGHAFMTSLQVSATQLVSTIHCIYVTVKVYLLERQNLASKYKILQNRKLLKVLY